MDALYRRAGRQQQIKTDGQRENSEKEERREKMQKLESWELY
jgi:hypothetical protein